jgi:hypothetical protein
MATAETEYAEYQRQVFDYEEQAYQAALQEDYDKAIEIWADVLADDGMKQCFSDAAVHEIAFNLAAAYLFADDWENCKKTMDDHKFTDDERAAIGEPE